LITTIINTKDETTNTYCTFLRYVFIFLLLINFVLLIFQCMQRGGRGGSSRARSSYESGCRTIALASVSASEVEVQERLLITRGKARYWRHKAIDPTFHDKPLGGAKNFKFSVRSERMVHLNIWNEIVADPLRNVKQLYQLLVIISYDLLSFICVLYMIDFFLL
jgi:hypothetical protein